MTLENAKQFGFRNGAAEIIRRLMEARKYKVQDLAKLLEIKPQSLSTKLYRDRFTFQEFQMIIFLLEAELNVNIDGKRIY